MIPLIHDTPVSNLTYYAGNARRHSPAQVEQIAASITEFGFTNPVLVDENNTIIAGHGRVDAAKFLKMQKVPCIVLVGLSEAQKRAYIIADNKLALNATWDIELLMSEVSQLEGLDFDMDLLGFSSKELTKLHEDLDMMALAGDEILSKKPETDSPAQLQVLDAGDIDHVVPEAKDKYLPLTITMLKSERAKVYATLAQYKTARGLSSTGEAFVELIAEMQEILNGEK